MSDPTYVTCPICKTTGHFTAARRIFTLPMTDDTHQRNWAAGENDSANIVCANPKCRTWLRWDPAAQVYKVFEAGGSAGATPGTLP